MSAFSLDPLNAPWAWHGVAEWQKIAQHHFPWRMTRALTASAHNEHFTTKVCTPAGVHARVHTDATALRIRGLVDSAGAAGREGTRTGATGFASLDILVDGQLLKRIEIPASSRPSVIDTGVALPPGEYVLEVWLPHQEVFGLAEATLTGCSYVRPGTGGRPLWLSYGSSITQCAAAVGPSRTWPALVAADLGLSPYAIGLGGQCHLDDAVSRTIASQPTDFLSLCLGINIYGRGSFDERSLGSALNGFIQGCLDDHPGIPIAVMSPILAPDLEHKPNHVGLTVAQVRDTVHRVTASINDRRLCLIDGRHVLGEADTDFLSSDQVHPTAAGYEFMAERLTPLLAKAFGRPFRSSPPEGQPNA